MNVLSRYPSAIKVFNCPRACTRVLYPIVGGTVCQFGAIASNAGEGRFKYSFQQSSPEEAASRALAECEADCSMVQQVIDSKTAAMLGLMASRDWPQPQRAMFGLPRLDSPTLRREALSSKRWPVLNKPSVFLSGR